MRYPRVAAAALTGDGDFLDGGGVLKGEVQVGLPRIVDSLRLHADIGHLEFQVLGVSRYLQVIVTVHVGDGTADIASLGVDQHDVGTHDGLLGTAQHFADGTRDDLVLGYHAHRA